MNRCLYCSKPCSETAVFCDGCRVSLLKRQPPLGKVEEASSSPSSAEQEPAIQPAQIVTPPVISLAEDAAETFEEKPTIPISAVSSGSSLVPISPLSLPCSTAALALQRRRVSMSTRVRIALMVLALVGTILLLVNANLPATQAPQYHKVQSAGTTTSATAAALGKTNTPTSPAIMPTSPGTMPTSSATTPTSPATTPASDAFTPGTGTETSTTTPGSGKPWLQLSSLHLAFQYTQGQANPGGQAVTISNADESAFSWQVNAGTSPSWPSVAPVQDNVSASSTGQVVVSVQPAQLTPGVYTSQLSVSATSSTGAPLQNSPQTLTVTLTVLAPCVLEATPSQLSFTALLLQQNPPGKTITLKATGGCGLPVTWTVIADASWVQFSSSSGSDNGSGSSLTVYTHTNSILGSYTAHITLTAVDSNGTVQSSPGTITVTLTVIA